MSSLFDAVRANRLNEVLDLLDEGENPNSVDAAGRTPLFDAAAGARNNIVVGLLLYNSDPRRKSNAGKRARDCTTNETTQTLLDLWCGFPVDVSKKQGAISTLNDFLQKHAAIELPKIAPASPEEVREAREPVEKKDVSIAWAVRSGSLKEVRRLLRQRADPNEFDALGEPPIFSALRTGDLEIPALLLMHAADPAKKSRSGGVAKDCTSSITLTALLDVFQDKQLTNNSRRALVSALSHTPDDIQQLITTRLGSPVTSEIIEVTGTANTGYIQASPTEQSPSLDALLRAIDAENSGAISSTESPNVVEDEVVDIDDDDPLMFAVRNNMLDTVLKLIREGDADPNACDILGETPLFEAVSAGSLDIATALLHHSADPEHRSGSGMRPVDFASCKHMRLLVHMFTTFKRRDVEKLPEYADVQALCAEISNEEMRGLAWRVMQNCQALILSATIQRRCAQGGLSGLPSVDNCTKASILDDNSS